MTSLGLRTDVALRVLEGAEVVDRGDYLVIRSLDNPGFWWGNFLLLDAVPAAGTVDRWLARFAAEFPAARHVALGVDTTDDQPVIPAEFPVAGLEAQRATVLTCTAVGPPPHPNSDAEIRSLESGADWEQSFDLGVRCFGADGAQNYMRRRVDARQRLTQAGRGAWFGAFTGGRLLAQLGVCDAGGGFARYQDVETDPAARRLGLAGTLLWHAGRYGREVLAASTLVIVADPADVAIRIYRACGFTDQQSQLTFARPPAS
ncbi:MAG: GNAT family N-acetyltransferase [Actinomycetota bacterium]|nr:GNAT family N-acetyltransferase [Actinomycetota bacterium]